MATSSKIVYPIERASLLSKLFFFWAPSLFYKRYRKKYTKNDVYNPLEVHDSKILGDDLEELWETQRTRNDNPSLWCALWKLFHKRIVILSIIFILSEFSLKMTQPWLIGKLMKCFNSGLKAERRDKFVYGALILLTSFLSVLVGHSYLLGIQHLGMQVRVACTSLIYRKILKLSSISVAHNTTGKIVNLLSNDVGRLDLAAMHFLQLLVAPIETLFVLWCLYYSVGFSAISGILFLAIFIPIQMYMGKLAATYRSKTAERTDQRVKLMNEVISAIQVIKMYTWERPFVKLITRAREMELRQIQVASYLKALNVSFMLLVNRTGIFLSIATHILINKNISAEYVFVVTAFYAILRQTLTVYIPFGINNFSETKIAVERIKEFLLCDEVLTSDAQQDVVYHDLSSDGKRIEDQDFESLVKANQCIVFQNVFVKWTHSSGENILKDINFVASHKELIIITGPVGSGKTTFLNAILWECPVIKGKLVIKGSISYASQMPWLFSASIRENILFGLEYDEIKYKQIIEVCELLQDFQTFPNSDESLVGERGVLLSGGQRARINLARAIYKDADIYLLDDPLASLDARVSNIVFQKCILGYLKSKCVILVTNDIKHFEAASNVYLITKGILELKADYYYLENSFKTFVREKDSDNVISKEEITKSSKTEIEKELTKSGSISNYVYKKYFTSGGDIFFISTMCLLFLMAQCAASGVDYFLGYWVNNYETDKQNNLLKKNIYFYIYMSLIICSILIITARSFIFFMFCIKASKNLHSAMLLRFIKAPVTFFNSNPSGQILNRFSKDMGLVDEFLPRVIMETLQIALIAIGSAVILSWVNPYMLIPSCASVLLFIWFRKIYLFTSRNLKRLESASKSPVFSHISGTLMGLTTIRSLHVQNMLQSQFDGKQNVNNSAFFMFLTCNRAFGFWIDLICAVYMIIAITSVLLLDTQKGNTGLAITQSVNLIGVCQWGLRQWTEWENQMISVERLVEYMDIKDEDDYVEVKEIPPKEWPQQGRIYFNSVSVRYIKSEPEVLTDITLSIEGGEKICIVGRTGAGKSSLILTIFRLFEFDGVITIDDFNIKDIPLEILRSKISIIPQEPKLFHGTIRTNLDPFSAYNDTKLWKVLEEVELKQHILELPYLLDNEVLEGGSNFSVGQKQLLCLARAILRNNKILILDEATSSIDQETDHLIQATIKRNFKNNTVLMVTHKLSNALECQKVLILDSGRITEFDDPQKLIQDTNSEFHKLFR